MTNPALVVNLRDLSSLLDSVKNVINNHRAAAIVLSKKGHKKVEALRSISRVEVVGAIKSVEESGINMHICVYRTAHSLCIMQLIKEKSFAVIRSLLVLDAADVPVDNAAVEDQADKLQIASIAGMLSRGLLPLEAQELQAATLDTLIIELYDDETCTLEDARNLHDNLPVETFSTEIKADLVVLHTFLHVEEAGETNVRVALSKSRTAARGIYFPLRYMKFGQKLRRDAANFCQAHASASLNNIKVKELGVKMRALPPQEEWVDATDC
jgi:hypothetical protein